MRHSNLHVDVKIQRKNRGVGVGFCCKTLRFFSISTPENEHLSCIAAFSLYLRDFPLQVCFTNLPVILQAPGASNHLQVTSRLKRQVLSNRWAVEVIHEYNHGCNHGYNHGNNNPRSWEITVTELRRTIHF